MYFSAGTTVASLVVVRATRPSVGSEWDNTEDTGVPGSDAQSTADEQTLFVTQADGANPRDIYRVAVGDNGYGTPTRASDLSSPTDDDGSVWISEDKKVVYFVSGRDGPPRIFRAFRPNPLAAFDPPQVVPELHTQESADDDPWLSPDGCTIVFASDRGGLDFDLYIATR